MPSGTRSAKPKPSEVAAEAKRYYIPLIRSVPHQYSTWSYAFPVPALVPLPQGPRDLSPPIFYVQYGDPVETAVAWQDRAGVAIPFICAANDKRPGGDWDTGVVGYEERLCRRSTLSATLATPGPDTPGAQHYPIPSTGGIFSNEVVIFRGGHDRYEKYEPGQWRTLPVCSVPPTRWPKLTQNGTKYSFLEERDMVKSKLSGAIRLCAYNGYRSVVIGDWGLGNGFRNPVQELAELWREVFLWDPDIRGRIQYVTFVFEDIYQSTTQHILDDIVKKSKSSRKGAGSSGITASSPRGCHTDMQIFEAVFDQNEIQRVLSQPDSRYELNTLLA